MAAFRKDDAGKTKYSEVDPLFEKELADVLSYGASRYGSQNWRNCPDPYERYYSALRRHVEAYARGEEFDQESKLPHLAHAAACLHFLRYFQRRADRGSSGVPYSTGGAEPGLDETRAPGCAGVARKLFGPGTPGGGPGDR